MVGLNPAAWARAVPAETTEIGKKPTCWRAALPVALDAGKDIMPVLLDATPTNG